MPYKLYYYPNTASLGPHWVLIELEAHGVTHTLSHVDLDVPALEQKAPAYLSINPHGRVPALLLDPDDPSTALTESAAILLFLAETYPAAHLAPPPGHPARAAFLGIYTYIVNSLLPALRDWTHPKDGEPAGRKAVQDLAGKRIVHSWEYLDGLLEGKKYLAGGEGPSIADYLAAMTVSWTTGTERMALKEDHHNVKHWIGDMRSRENWKEVLKREEGWVVRERDCDKELVLSD